MTVVCVPVLLPVTVAVIVWVKVGVMDARLLVGEGVIDVLGEGENMVGEVGVTVGVLVELERVGFFS